MKDIKPTLMRVNLAVIAGLILSCHSTSDAKEGLQGRQRVRDNGLVWMRFGPAILHSSKYISFNNYEENGKKFVRYEISDSDKNFPKVKGLICKNFELLINCSPEEPHCCVKCQNALYLYTKPVSHENERIIDKHGLDQDGLPNLKLRQAYLIKIPINDILEGDKAERLKSDLKRLMRIDPLGKNPYTWSTMEDLLKEEKQRVKEGR
ncbi:MAG: hypothetical protein J0M35_15790 [Candidatus Obscuribacter phosphatis]|uniref:Lipoprotein n=1 Tax=Candidatus Obscuribacter phosphatis TaxID=1906157 RepID=A0A8J7P8F7_9BACT|nr:hypothetical protein [Candidatus Obscuribacter phosphatis]